MTSFFSRVTLGLSLLGIPLKVFSASTYIWSPQGGSQDITIPANWNPTRNSPANDDILQFDNTGTACLTPNTGTSALANFITGNFQFAGTNSYTLTLGDTQGSQQIITLFGSGGGGGFVNNSGTTQTISLVNGSGTAQGDVRLYLTNTPGFVGNNITLSNNGVYCNWSGSGSLGTALINSTGDISLLGGSATINTTGMQWFSDLQNAHITLSDGQLNLNGANADHATITTAGAYQINVSNSATLAYATLGPISNTPIQLWENTTTGSACSVILAGGASITFNKADTSGYTNTIGSINSTSTDHVYLSSGANGTILTIGTNNADSNIQSPITETGTSSIIKTGSGTLTLGSTSNNFSGGITLTGGVTSISSDSNLGASTGTVYGNGGTLLTTSGVTFSSSRPFTLNSGTTLTLDSGGNTSTISGTISGAGGLIKAGAGTLVFGSTAIPSYTGTTTISQGTLEVSTSSGLSNSDVVINSGATLLTEANFGLGSLSGSGTFFLKDSSVWFGGNNNNTTFDGTFVQQQTGWLGKIGSGVLTLGPNTASCAGIRAYLFSGVLSISTSNSIGNFDFISFEPGSTLQVTGTNTVTLGNLNTLGVDGAGTITFDIEQTGGSTTITVGSNNLNGVGTLQKTGAGTLTLSGSHSYTGGTILTGGVLSVSSDNNLGALTGTVYGNGGTLLTTSGVNFSSSRPFTLNSGTTTSFDTGGNTTTISGTVSGSGTFSKINPGILVLSNLNTYTGNIAVNGGTLRAGIAQSGANGAFGSSPPVTIASGATLDLNGFNNTIGNLSGTGSITTGTATLTISGTGSYAGVISGTGGVIKQAAGTLTFSGTNTFSGGVTLTGGILSISSDSNLGASSGTVYGNGGTLLTTGTLSSSRPVVLNAGTTSFNVTSNTDLTFSGSVSGTGTLQLVNGGRLWLTGNNTYTNSFAVTAGQLLLQGSSSLGSTTLSSSGSGKVGCYINGGTSTINAYGSEFYWGSTANAGSAMISTGSNCVFFFTSGSRAGLAHITGTNAGQIGFQGGSLADGATINATNTLVYFESGASAGSANITMTGHLLEFNLSGGTTPVSDTVGSITSDSTNRTILNNITLTIGGNNSDSNIQGTLEETTVNSSVSSIVKVGTGTLTLGNTNNNFAGGVTLTGGVLSISSGSNLGAITGTVVGNGGTLLTTSGVTFSSSRPFTLNAGTTTSFDTGGNTTTIAGTVSGSGTFSKINPGILALSNPNTFTGNIAVNGGTLRAGVAQSGANGAFGSSPPVTIASGAVLDLNGFHNTIGNLSGTGSITLDSATLTISGTGSYAGVISGTGGITKQAPGILNLSGVSTYTGATTVSSGTLQAGTAGAFGNNSSVTVASGAVLDLNSHPNTLGNLLGAGTVTLGTGGNLTVSAASGTFSGAISGTGNLTLTSPDTFILTGTAHNTGNTSLTSGNFKVTGALSSTNIDIGADAVLMGTGTLTVASGGMLTISGTVSPGASIGTIYANGDVTFASGSTIYNEINSTTGTGNSDNLTVNNGNLFIGDNITIIVVPDDNGVYNPGTEHEIITLNGNEVISPLHPTFTIQAPSSLKVTVKTGPQEVALFVDSVPFTTYVNSGNPGQVAAAIDTLSNTYTAPSTAISQDLLYLSPVGMTYAFNQMHPAIYKSSAIVQENNAVAVQGSLNHRFNTVLETENAPCVYLKKAWNLWITGLGDYLSQGTMTPQEGSEYGYHTKTGGISGGIDYKLGSRWFAGALGAYTHTSIHWDHTENPGLPTFQDFYLPSSWGKRFATQKIDTDYAGIYLSFLGSKAYANLSAIGAWGTYEGTRNIIFPGVNESAYNKHEGKQLLSHLDVGLKMTQEGMTLRPFDALDWIVQHEDGYTETGSETYDLTVRKSRTALLRNELGLIFSSSVCRAKTRVTGDVKLGWVREIRYGSKLTAEFAGTDVPFTVVGYFPDRNLLSYGASVAGEMGQLTYSVYYEGEVGHRYSDQTFGLQCAVGF